MFDVFHPVGTLYETLDASFNPNTASGWSGTWERIKDRFVYACGDNQTIGSTGGSNTHTLTVAELPSHSHGLNNHTHSYAHTHTTPSQNITTSGNGSHVHESRDTNTYAESLQAVSTRRDYFANTGYTSSYSGQPRNLKDIMYAAGSHTHTATVAAMTTNSQSSTTTGGNTDNTTNTGSGTAIDMRPAFIRAYIWKRTD